jgi:hypothetical protein
MVAGAIIATNVAPENLFAETKLSHEAAKYRDHPKETGSNALLCPIRTARFMQKGGGSSRC